MATQYVILFHGDGPNDSDGYEVLVGTVEASSALSAVREAAARDQNPGSYCAIPARSWEPVKIEFEAQPRVKVVKT